MKGLAGIGSESYGLEEETHPFERAECGAKEHSSQIVRFGDGQHLRKCAFRSEHTGLKLSILLMAPGRSFAYEEQGRTFGVNIFSSIYSSLLVRQSDCFCRTIVSFKEPNRPSMEWGLELLQEPERLTGHGRGSPEDLMGLMSRSRGCAFRPAFCAATLDWRKL